MNSQRRLVFLVSILIYCIFSAFFWNYSIDDAFITFRYAENFADGYGLVFNVDDKPLEGYSNFLWLLFLALLFKIGIPIYPAAKIIGLISFAAAAFLIYRYFERDLRHPAWLAGPLFLISPIAAFWGVSGLELGLHTLVLTAAVIAVLHRSPWAVPALALLVLSRPEGIALGMGMVVVAVISDLADRKLNKGWFAISFAVLAVTVAGLTIFRMSVFGYPLPNTYYAKIHHHLEIGFYELWRLLKTFAPLTIVFLAAFYLVIKRKLKDRELSVFVTVFFLQAMISARMDPVMNFLGRYTVMAIPFFVAAGLITVGSVKSPVIRRTVIALFGVSLMLPLPKTVEFVRATDLMMEAQRKVFEWAHTLAPGTTISMSDMGRVPYHARHIHFYDIYGLVSEEIAHDGFKPAREFGRFPDYFIFVGYIEDDQLKLSFWREQTLAYSEIFNSAYEPFMVCLPDGKTTREPGYYYFAYKKSENVGEPRKDSDGKRSNQDR